MIQCTNVTKRFGQVVAADNVCLEIRSGICALIGPNGAGKSTLLKLLTGMLRPDAGEIRIGGLDPVQHPLEVKRIIGVLPEDLGLFGSLTVQEHFELAGPIYGLSKTQTSKRADSLLRFLKLESAAQTFLDQCSHGTRKKTALALALLHNPKVLFLDEPFENLDPEAMQATRHLLTTIAQRGITIFLTSHMLSVVDKLTTETRLMRAGRIVWSSSAQSSARPLEEVYFEMSEPPEDLPWLRS